MIIGTKHRLACSPVVNCSLKSILYLYETEESDLYSMYPYLLYIYIFGVNSL